MSSHSVWVLIYLFGVLLYAALGGLGVRWWQRRTRIPRPQSLQADPRGYVRYWLPQLMALEIYWLTGTTILMMTLAPWLHGSERMYFDIGTRLGIVLSLVLFASIDVFMLVLARREMKRQA